MDVAIKKKESLRTVPTDSPTQKLYNEFYIEKMDYQCTGISHFGGRCYMSVVVLSESDAKTDSEKHTAAVRGE